MEYQDKCFFYAMTLSFYQLIDLVNAIRHAFDSTKSLEVHAIFLDKCDMTG